MSIDMAPDEVAYCEKRAEEARKAMVRFGEDTEEHCEWHELWLDWRELAEDLRSQREGRARREGERGRGVGDG